ncbi:exodeoxyribonuclease VII large subunit [Roseovarius sp. SCSIO 43702]|uniref:exodeoxyribonuclease VII large subunit n=1 Tax=Roseovarius sp. SCSIO 43702 TaxID=2823043 RepID=UPI001C72D4E4|nr:exodeoxyribonuclease VII large subunit [Roseovarius sp. SCSIO 43702]QYX56925.1 exodeoxyribonuclease VII large subunit [Roseovarius sp. SCSIO 43702]
MSDLIDEPRPGGNLPEYTVSEISGEVKRTLEGTFGRVRVRGEVGRVFRARSGHLYYDVKDDRNVLACTTWKGQIANLSVEPEEGLEVVVTGRLTSFGAQSKYNLNVDEVAVAGQGALMALLEKRRKALAEEGLFDEARKRPLPYLPEIIGVVTSPSGAVIRDILHRLRDRFPRKVLIWPVAVQGANCAPEVARAIAGFNALTPGGALPRPDLIIVARGGGSIEDLWGFNEEAVVRAAAASEIPLISAVGHETDTTLVDFAADRRAPTPTAAAELAVPVRLDLLAWVDGQAARLSQALSRGMERRGERLRDLSRAVPRVETLLDGPRQRLDFWGERLPAALTRSVQLRRVELSEVTGALRPGVLRGKLRDQAQRVDQTAARLAPALGRQAAQGRERFDAMAARHGRCRPDAALAERRARLENFGARLSQTGSRQMRDLRERIGALDRLRETLSYKATLNRGYAVVRGDGDVVTRKAAAAKAGALEIEFADGKLNVGSPEGPAKRPPRSKLDVPEQGDLF